MKKPCPNCMYKTKYVGCPKCWVCNGTGEVEQ